MTPSPIDPELRRVATVLPRGGGIRAIVWLDRALGPLADRRDPPDVEVATVGPNTIRIHRPPAGAPTSGAALLWIHGGGFVLGSPTQDDDLCRRFARELGIVVAGVGYRRAPEHPFPTPLHDCHDALVWLAERPDIDPARIAIGGASAGGGLTASLALLARERGEVRPALQLLSYPMLDDRTATRTDIDERTFRLWNNRANRFGWQSYLGRAPGSSDVDPLAAPARCDDLAGLPPAWMGVGSCDLFYDEDLAYARALHGAGVPTDLHVAVGGYHAFDMIGARATISRRYRDAQLDALRHALRLDEPQG